MKLAWFSPLPPSTSGIAAYSAELLPLLEEREHVIDTFTETNARDFVWKHRRAPYDLTVFQMGNAACHDYMWAYVFRYPGLVVLHDAQLHQARALWLTKRWQPRRHDYLAEFHANHPEAPGDLGELVAAGLGGSLYQYWPLIRLVVESARTTIVHNKRLAEDLREQYPRARFEHVEMGIKDPLLLRPERPVLRRGDRIVVAAFGGITPEKRLTPLIRAISAMADRHPQLQLMLVGGQAGHYDVVAEARRWGIADRLRMTGYVPDWELADHLLAADICACLRWPTNRETSASWLRCLAAGRATIITDLAHLADVPSLDPRGWRVLAEPAHGRAGEPVCVSIDILDEEHSLQLALARLVTDAELRNTLGRAARNWWATHHQLETMANGYDRVVREAVHTPPPRVALPRHLMTDGSTRARSIVAEFDVGGRLQDVLGSSST